MTAPRMYRSSTPGAPILSGQVGKLTDLLDAVLINGYNPRAVTTLSRSGALATAGFGSAPGFAVGDPVEISGANEAAFNGDFTVTVAGANSIGFPVPDSGPTTATGTITAKIAPARWTMPFTGTHKRAYRPPAAQPVRPWILIRDDAPNANANFQARMAWIGLYESMVDVDTGAGGSSFGSRRLATAFKSTSADATARQWVAFVGEGVLYLLWNPGLPTNRCLLLAFGAAADPFATGDPYVGLIAGGMNPTATTAFNFTGADDYVMIRSFGTLCGPTSYPVGDQVGVYLQRALGGALPALQAARFIAPWTNFQLSQANYHQYPGGNLATPEAATQLLYFEPVLIAEAPVTVLRGRMPGLHCVANSFPSTGFAVWPFFVDGDFADGSTRTLALVPLWTSGFAEANPVLGFDLTGPW